MRQLQRRRVRLATVGALCVELVRLVVPGFGHWSKFLFVLVGMVSAEQEFAPAQGCAYVGLGSAAVATVKRAHWTGRCGCFRHFSSLL